ncbi:EGF-like domain protein, partial [Cooperia oncophora]
VSGKNCEIAPNRCLGEPCLNGGVCGDFGSRQECSCPKKFTGAGFTGVHCETNIDDCARSPCPLGATCIDQINSAYCRCPFNMTGTNCDKIIDEDYDLHFFDSLRPAKKPNYSAELIEVLHLDSEGIKIALFPNETALPATRSL